MIRFTLVAICLVFMGFTHFRTAVAEQIPAILSSSATKGVLRQSLFTDANADAGSGTETKPEMQGNTVDRSQRLAPWKVAMISAAVPGFGQIYNDAAWKLPVYYGLMGYFAYRAIDANSSYNDYRYQYLSNPSSPDAGTVSSLRDDYRETRNRQLVFLCLAYVAGIVDAYVDAQLYGFDTIIGESLGASSAQMLHSQPIVSVHMNF